MMERRGACGNAAGPHFPSRARALRARTLEAVIGGLLCLAMLAAPASGFEIGGREAARQFSDTVTAQNHRQVAALHVTALRGETNFAEVTWGVGALPCGGQHLSVNATEGQIAETQASSRELEIDIVEAHFSGSLHCGSTLPSATNEGEATVTIKPVRRSDATTGPVSVYEDEETKVKSFSACITLANMCNGRYVLRAYLNAPRIHARLVYVFTVKAALGLLPGAYAEQAGALPSITDRLEQCPLPVA
jgi:hypothetical protein